MNKVRKNFKFGVGKPKTHQNLMGGGGEKFKKKGSRLMLGAPPWMTSTQDNDRAWNRKKRGEGTCPKALGTCPDPKVNKSKNRGRGEDPTKKGISLKGTKGRARSGQGNWKRKT